MNMSRNFLSLKQLPKVELGSTSSNGDCKKKKIKKTLRDKFISGRLTLRNVWCNLCGNGVTKLQDKLQAKLPNCVTLPYISLDSRVTRDVEVTTFCARGPEEFILSL